MNQYTPQPGLADYPGLQRRLTAGEYDELINHALALGLENGFIQEEGAAAGKIYPDL